MGDGSRGGGAVRTPLAGCGAKSLTTNFRIDKSDLEVQWKKPK